jgi:hypothetical protein
MSQSQPKITFDQAKEAIAFPFQNIGAVIKLGLFPFLLAVVAIFTIFVDFAPGNIDVQAPDAIPQLERAPLPDQLLTQLIVIILGSIFAVGIHRHIVLGQPASWVFFRFRKYELFYILISIVILALMSAFFWAVFFLLTNFASELAFLPGKSLAILIFIADWVIYIWLYVKLILALPNAAITGRISLATSWHALRGNVWQFIGYTLVIVLSYIVPIFFLTLIGGALFETQGSLLIALVLNLLVIVASVFLGVSFLAYLSYVYRQLIAKPAQDAWTAQNGGAI